MRRETGKPSQGPCEQELTERLVLPNDRVGVGSRKVIGTDHMLCGGPDH